ncbi:MAG: hypothetical protein H7831_18180, partial [Magnetococcus sp. WYHC-3]
LDIFDKKFKMAKEDAADIKAALKKFDGGEHEKLINSIKKELEGNRVVLSEKREKIESSKKFLEKVRGVLAELERSIREVPTKVIDIKLVTSQIKDTEKQLGSLRDCNVSFKESLEAKKELMKKMDLFLSQEFDIETYKERKVKIDEISRSIQSFEGKRISINKTIDIYNKKIELLGQVPCGGEYDSCRFVKDAHESLKLLELEQESLKFVQETIALLEYELKSLEPEKTIQYIEKHVQLDKRKRVLQDEISSIEVNVYKNESLIMKNEQSLSVLLTQKQEYEKNKEQIENLEHILSEKEEKQLEIKRFEVETRDFEVEILRLYKQRGQLEQQLSDLENKKAELSQLRKDYAAYDLFLQCMHYDGIPYRIIKKKLPIVNNEIAKILANVVNFGVSFEADGNKLNINIKYEGFEARPLELASGAEKTISALAIRIAMLKICNLPKPNFIILDETVVGLDESITDGFVKMLDVLKENFQFVLLITHLDSLKDCADSEIVIEHREKYAYIKHGKEESHESNI